jgi:hypothetical protein
MLPAPKLPITQYQSPSWSWLVVLDRELWEPYTFYIEVAEVYEEAAEVLKCTVELVDKDAPFGQVRSGQLILRAKLAVFTKVPPIISVPWKGYEKDWGISIDYDIGNHIAKPECHYLLLGFNTAKSAIGLVLVFAKDGTFKRVGHFKFRKKDKEYRFADDLEKRVITII